MSELKVFPVFGPHGQIGTLSAPARFLDQRAEKPIQTSGGTEVWVPADALEIQPDGSFLLQGPALDLFGVEPAKQTISDSSWASVQKNESFDSSSIPPAKQSDGNEALYRESYTIERVPVDRLISEPAAQRQEGDTLILPVLEEVLVTEKRIMLKEEIRITKSRDAITG